MSRQTDVKIQKRRKKGRKKICDDGLLHATLLAFWTFCQSMDSIRQQEANKGDH
jgi:hypothetical protein